MSVIVEFSLPTEAFLFGSALATVEEMTIELEAVVPTGDRIVPYFWATGEGFEAFERHVREDPNIEGLTRLDRIDDTGLYRADRAREMNGLIAGLAETEAVLLEAATVDDAWYFRIRFHDHDLLGQFYNYCTDHEITIHVKRVYTLTEPSRAGLTFDLTPEQRAAILLAVENGYFKVPRETDLSAIAEELGISQQAASKRVRRGADTVLRAVLFRRGEHP